MEKHLRFEVYLKVTVDVAAEAENWHPFDMLDELIEKLNQLSAEGLIQPTHKKGDGTLLPSVTFTECENDEEDSDLVDSDDYPTSRFPYPQLKWVDQPDYQKEFNLLPKWVQDLIKRPGPLPEWATALLPQKTVEEAQAEAEKLQKSEILPITE